MFFNFFEYWFFFNFFRLLAIEVKLLNICLICFLFTITILLPSEFLKNLTDRIKKVACFFFRGKSTPFSYSMLAFYLNSKISVSFYFLHSAELYYKSFFLLCYFTVFLFCFIISNRVDLWTKELMHKVESSFPVILLFIIYFNYRRPNLISSYLNEEIFSWYRMCTDMCVKFWKSSSMSTVLIARVCYNKKFFNLKISYCS